MSETQETQERMSLPLAIGIDSDEDEERTQIISSDGWHLCYIEQSPTVDNARYIVRACNAFPASLSTLRRVSALMTIETKEQIISEEQARLLRDLGNEALELIQQ